MARAGISVPAGLTLRPGPGSESSPWVGLLTAGLSGGLLSPFAKGSRAAAVLGPEAAGQGRLPRSRIARVPWGEAGQQPARVAVDDCHTCHACHKRLGGCQRPRPLGAGSAVRRRGTETLSYLPGVSQPWRETRAVNPGRPAVTSAACRDRPQPGSACSAVRPRGPLIPTPREPRGQSSPWSWREATNGNASRWIRTNPARRSHRVTSPWGTHLVRGAVICQLRPRLPGAPPASTLGHPVPKTG